MADQHVKGTPLRFPVGTRVEVRVSDSPTTSWPGITVMNGPPHRWAPATVVEHECHQEHLCPSFYCAYGVRIDGEGEVEVVREDDERIIRPLGEEKSPSSTKRCMGSQQCSYCGKEAAPKTCTRCKRAFYCGVECQRKDWKEHKKVCFSVGAKCTRCLETIDASNAAQCLVPHPAHMLQDMGSSFGGGRNTWNFQCGQCDQFFTKESSQFDEEKAPITRGAKYCYQGRHTTKPLPDSDKRRVRDGELVLYAKQGLQREIDDIPKTMPNVKTLVIQSGSYYDESMEITLEVSMPKLEKLKLIDVAFEKITLNAALTPKVEELFLQNVPDSCKMTVQLPELTSFTINYYGPLDDDSWLHDMLSTASKLVSFDSYKLRPCGELHFAGNDLEYIRLHRAETLQTLSVCAPNLGELNLQGCYDLYGDLTIRESHPDFERPPGSEESRFVVNATNACLSEENSQTLQNHPRVILHDSAPPGNPMEGMFANMHSMMG